VGFGVGTGVGTGVGIGGRVALAPAVAEPAGVTVVCGPGVRPGAYVVPAVPLEPGPAPALQPAVSDASGDHGIDASQDATLPSGVGPDPEPEVKRPPEPPKIVHAAKAAASARAPAAAVRALEARSPRMPRSYEPPPEMACPERPDKRSLPYDVRRPVLEGTLGRALGGLHLAPRSREIQLEAER
jgi:pyruvate/2-oxoglutarate dehydrogenase complex dihydrolipoamide acyltransferase (E2) component